MRTRSLKSEKNAKIVRNFDCFINKTQKVQSVFHYVSCFNTTSQSNSDLAFDWFWILFYSRSHWNLTLNYITCSFKKFAIALWYPLQTHVLLWFPKRCRFITFIGLLQVSYNCSIMLGGTRVSCWPLMNVKEVWF